MPSKDEAEVIDETRLTQLKVQILQAEQGNLNTAERTADQMVELIQTTIKNIVDKAY